MLKSQTFRKIHNHFSFSFSCKFSKRYWLRGRWKILESLKPRALELEFSCHSFNFMPRNSLYFWIKFKKGHFIVRINMRITLNVGQDGSIFQNGTAVIICGQTFLWCFCALTFTWETKWTHNGLRFKTGVKTRSVHMKFQDSQIFQWTYVGISFWAVFYRLFSHPNKTLFLSKVTDCQNDRHEIHTRNDFKSTCTLNEIFNESVLIHFVSGKFCSHENLMPVWNFISVKIWNPWNPYNFAFYFSSKALVIKYFVQRNPPASCFFL